MKTIKYTINYCKNNKVAIKVNNEEEVITLLKIVKPNHAEDCLRYLKNSVDWYIRLNSFDTPFDFTIQSDFFVKNNGYRIITLEDFILDNKEEFPRANFAVVIENNAREIIDYLVSKGFTNDSSGIYKSGGYCVNDQKSFMHLFKFSQYVSKTYTLEELKELGNMNEKKIIGYKLIKPEYKEAAEKVGNFSNFETFEHFETISSQTTINVYRKIVEKFKKAEVLDLWFKPVYEPEKPIEKVITVNGVKITIKQGSLEAEGTRFNLDYLTTLSELFYQLPEPLNWNITIESVKIGCKTGWTKKHLEEIIREYQEFNK